MYNPHILESNAMFEAMIKRHAEEIYAGYYYWHEIKNDKEQTIQLVPVAELLFKF